MGNGIDLAGLDDFAPSDLITNKKPGLNTKSGELSYAPIDRFIEDENNARKTYDKKALDELVESIKAISPITKKMTGVKQPLSVREHPDKPGYFIINGGSRRYRAAKIAGLDELPYFLANDNDDFDNVVDNLIRDGLRTEEVAEFICDQIKKGVKKSDIAKRLGKTNSFVSDHAVFFDLPEPIKLLFDNGFCNTIQSLAILHRAHKSFPDEVSEFCAQQNNSVSQKDVNNFVSELKQNKSKDSNLVSDKEGLNNGESAAKEYPEEKSKENKKNETMDKDNTSEKATIFGHGSDLKRPAIIVNVGGRAGRIILKDTLEYGKIIVEYDDGGVELTEANKIKLEAVVED